MEKWTFNQELLSTLSDVLDISVSEIAKRCDMTQQTLLRYIKNDFVLPVQALIQMCNALRMPVRFFVSCDNVSVIPQRENATIPKDRWHPIEWDTAAVEQTFGDGPGRIYWKEAADAMKVTQQKPRKRFMLEVKFPVTDFLSTCTSLGISPYRFLIDMNQGECRRWDSAPVGGGMGARSVREEVSRLRADLSEAVRLVKSHQRAIEELSRKYERLLTEHEALSRRLNVKIENVQSSYIGIAAEPGHDFNTKK